MKWLEFTELGCKLRIKAGDRVTLVNAPPECTRLIPGADGLDPERADVVIGFAARREQLDLLVSGYDAAIAGRRAWVGYRKPGRLSTDMHKDWLACELRRRSFQAVDNVSIDGWWSGLLVQPIEMDVPPEIDLAWPGA